MRSRQRSDFLSGLVVAIAITFLTSYWVAVVVGFEESNTFPQTFLARIRDDKIFFVINLVLVTVPTLFLLKTYRIYVVNTRIWPKVRHRVTELNHEMNSIAVRDRFADLEKYLSMKVEQNDGQVTRIVLRLRSMSTLLLRTRDDAIIVIFNGGLFEKYQNSQFERPST